MVTGCLFFFTFAFQSSFARYPPGLLPRCIYSCQKWIPDKILHRYDNSFFFSTHFFFDNKKSSWKWKNIFRENFECLPKNLNTFQISFRENEFSFVNGSKFSRKNIFFLFRNDFFLRKKMSWEKKWIIISMQNFVRNPFLAIINATGQYPSGDRVKWRLEGKCKKKRHISRFCDH